MKLYHGTNIRNAKNILVQGAKATGRNSRFYMTEDLELAKQYGSRVVCWELDTNNPSCSISAIFNKIGNILDQVGIEYVFTEQQIANVYRNTLVDEYIV